MWSLWFILASLLQCHFPVRGTSQSMINLNKLICWFQRFLIGWLPRLDEIASCHDFRRKLISTPRLIPVTKLMAFRTLDNGSIWPAARGWLRLACQDLHSRLYRAGGNAHPGGGFKNCGWPTQSQRFFEFFWFSRQRFLDPPGGNFFGFHWLSMGLEDTGGRKSRVELWREWIAFARSGFVGAFDSDPHRV